MALTLPVWFLPNLSFVQILFTLFWLLIIAYLFYKMWTIKKIKYTPLLLIAIILGLSFLPTTEGKCPRVYHSPQEICASYCDTIKQYGFETADYTSTLYEYCTRTFAYKANKSNENTNFINLGGDSIFCRDEMRCFNLGSPCKVNGSLLDARFCQTYLCQYYKTREFSVHKAEQLIKEDMAPKSCNLSLSAHPELQGKTWWEKYFASPNCSSITTTSSP